LSVTIIVSIISRAKKRLTIKPYDATGKWLELILAMFLPIAKLNLLPWFMSNSPSDPKNKCGPVQFIDGQEVTNLGLELGQSETNKGVL